MTNEDEKFLNRINEYADKVLGHIDPQKTQVSYQLEQLKPVMEEIAAEEGAKKPVQYVLTILDDWQSEHVMQPHHGEYEQLRGSDVLKQYRGIKKAGLPKQPGFSCAFRNLLFDDPYTDHAVHLLKLFLPFVNFVFFPFDFIL